MCKAPSVRPGTYASVMMEHTASQACELLEGRESLSFVMYPHLPHVTHA